MSPRLLALAPSLAALLVAATASGWTVPAPDSSLAKLQRRHPDLAVGRATAPWAEVASRLSAADAWAAYLDRLGPGAAVYFDLANGEPALVRGRPEPWIPGAGNGLSLADVGRRLGRQVDSIDAETVQALSLLFLTQKSSLLSVPIAELDHRSTSPAGPLWVVTYEHAPGGVPVADSRLTFVVGHGNLILWGSEGIFPVLPEAFAIPPISPDAARAAVAAFAGWDAARDAWLGEPLELFLVEAAGPATLAADRPGRRHRRVWEVAFARRGDPGTWVAQVDAATAEVLVFADANRYGRAQSQVRGGVQPVAWTGREESRPLGAIRVGGADGPGGVVASIEGLFEGAGPGAVETSLSGSTVGVVDQCAGPVSPVVATAGGEDVDFGAGPPVAEGGGDCATNGTGGAAGAGNTHAARSAYYHATRLKRGVADWLGELPWLTAPHEVRVNLPGLCNAFWSPSQGANGFFRSGRTASGVLCANTGELAAVVLHEVGHGVDHHDPQGAADAGTGEAYADVIALLELKDSCVGRGFLDRPCGGYGLPCTECTGVREVDWEGHVTAGGDPVAGPLTPANFTGPRCLGGFGFGPCGREPHCESLPATGAIWDLARRELAPALGEDAAWAVVERDWSLAMAAATAAFACEPGTFASDGCAATSWFSTLLAADDDDGDLTDGTPHAGAIYRAFAAHALACGAADDPANQDSDACPELEAPVAAAAWDGGDGVDVTWGPVSGAAGYAVWKGHGCAGPGLLAGELPGASTAFADGDVAPFQPYGYRVVALGTRGGAVASACASPPSACVEVTAGACAAPADPPGLAVPADNRIDVSWVLPAGCGGPVVHRRRDGCGGAGDAWQFVPAGPAASPPYADTTVSGGTVYGYRVAALDPESRFEVGVSPCAEATATGICNEPPAFAPGLAVDDAEEFGCALALSWTAAEPVCAGQPVVYNVYRGADAAFVPGDGNRVATGLIAPSYVDRGLAADAEAFYVVRAEALSGIGPGPGGGREDGNLAAASGVPGGPRPKLFHDDLEAGAGAWTVAPGPLDGPDGSTWQLLPGAGRDGGTVWFVADEPFVKDETLAITAPFVVPAGGLLRFWHRFHTELGYDGGVLEFSLDGGATWIDVLDGTAGDFEGGAPPIVAENPDRLLEGGYVEVLSACCGNPLPQRAAWSGDSAGWRRVVADLADLAGLTVRFRWRFGADLSRAEQGWWIDDVELVGQAGLCRADGLFADGFESGGLGAWSAGVPTG